MTMTTDDDGTTGEEGEALGEVYATSDGGEALRLESDGTITLRFDSRSYVLRRPVFGEYRDLKARYQELARATTTLAQANLAAIKDGKELPDEDDVYDLTEKFLRHVFDTLGDHALPDDMGRWPTWLVAGTNYGQWVNHWRSVPLARGVATDS